MGQQPEPVKVVATAEAAPLPEIPKEVASCLDRKLEAEQKRAKNADGVAEIGATVDRTKRSCWASHVKWYNQLREARTPKTAQAEPAKPAEAKKVASAKKDRPAATWE